MRQFQLIETPIVAIATNTPQRLLQWDDRRVYAGIWAAQQGSTTYISTRPSLFGGLNSQAPVLFASGQNGPVWEMYIDRHREMVKSEWWIYPSAMPATYIGTVYECLEWDDGRGNLIMPPPFTPDPHSQRVGIDVPDQMQQLVSDLLRLRLR